MKVILSDMEPTQVRRLEDGFIVLFCSRSGVNQVPLYFDVRLKKLSPTTTNLPDVPRNANRALLDEVVQAIYFHDALWRNGSVIVWDEERDIELARSAAFMPINVIYNREAVIAFAEEVGALIAALELNPAPTDAEGSDR